MSKIVLVGDLHLDIKEPFFTAGYNFLQWFLKQEFNNTENYFIQLGDFYHNSVPNPKVHALGLDFIKKLKFKQKYILSGNHNYNRFQDSYAEDPLLKYGGDTLKVIKEPLLLSEEMPNIKILFLPFIYDKTEKSKGLTQKDFYESLEEKSADYIFHHLEDETVNFMGKNKGIDLSKFKGKRIGGHIHIRNKGYLGTPFITREDEKNKKSYILLIDTVTKEETYIEVPKFIDYVDVNYNDTLEKDNSYIQYITINDVVTKDEAYSKFKDFYIKEVNLKKQNVKEKKVNSNLLNNKALSISEYYEKFIIDYKLDENVANKTRYWVTSH